MANIRTGPIVADIRGSSGDQTFSRNQGGLYVKSRSGPTGVPTANQIQVNDTMTLLSQAWSGTLTEAQRESWRTYAKQNPRPNTWGARSLNNGYTRFIRVNFPSAQAHDAIYTTTAPTAPPLGLPDFRLYVGVAAQRYYLYCPVMPELPADVDYTAYVYEGIEVNNGVMYYQSPFAYLGHTERTFTEWDGSSIAFDSSFLLTTGHKIFIRMRIQQTVTKAISPAAIASDPY